MVRIDALKVVIKLTIGENIKILRKEKGITQRELARSTNFSSSYIGDLEISRINPSIRALEIIAEHFEVDISYFFEGECCYERLLKQVETSVIKRVKSVKTVH